MRVTDFRNLVLGVVQVAQKYVDMYIDKNPPRIANTSDYGWLLETLKTLDECHKQLHMSTEIFIDLHDLLVSRYGLQPSMHMNTYEALAIFLFICAGNESNWKSQNRFNHSGETISRIFSEVDGSFGVWKMKWHILYKMPIYPMWNQKKIIVVTMVLHNHIREHKSGDMDFDRVERDEDYEPTILERYNKYVVTSDRSTSLTNAPTMDVFRDELVTAISMYWN
jgi:hypothetical protein